MYQGHDWDVIRWASTSLPPYHDKFGLMVISNFGSAHFNSFHAVFCDGSVRGIPYDIDPATHGYLANRNDGQLATLDDF